MPKVFNVGSLNIDHVYRVGRIAQPGETQIGSEYAQLGGGKGFNQSLALARAGVAVTHVGCIGSDGRWLREHLAQEGVDVSRVQETGEPTGHAVIQVDPHGQNAIVIFAGANRALSPAQLVPLLEGGGAGDWLLCQNETDGVPELIAAGHARGMTVCVNPAPMTAEVRRWPLDKINWLIVNESEGAELSGETAPTKIVHALRDRLPATGVVLTLGAAGVLCVSDVSNEVVEIVAPRVAAVDTTAAGDTFIGYFVAALVEKRPLRVALERACAAAAISVTRRGAGDSVPYARELKGV